MDVEQLIVRVYRQLWTEKSDENVVFSPASLYQALLMTACGANGETRQEMMQTLGINPGNSSCDQTIHKLCLQAFFEDLPKPDSYMDGLEPPELNTANAIYVSDQFELQDAFKSTIRDNYQGEIESCQFTSENAANLARKINEWVTNSTKDKITEILQPGDIDALTVMVILNAVYFKAFWHEQFESFCTEEGEFFPHTAGAGPIKVQYMQNKPYAFYKILPEMKAKIFGLPFACSNMKMVFILPDAKDKESFQNLVESLGKPGVLKKTLSPGDWHYEEVNIRLPKFEFDCEIDLGESLKAIGMPSAFDQGKADFGKMFKTIDQSNIPFIGMIRQKVFLKIDETGAEASAVTAVAIRTCCAAFREPMSFNADHPFICAILSAKNVPIFFGHVAQPTELK